MNKIIIFGNSGSGKSTLARSMASKIDIAHLDLDTIAWQKNQTPTRRPLKESYAQLEKFMLENNGWVIEGCYGDLIEYIIPFASEIIFLNPTVHQCIENAQKRPWEPHKYSSKKEQDKNLEFLISWIRDYDKREDNFSRQAHLKIYNNFKGKKKMIGGVDIRPFQTEDASALSKIFYEVIREVNIADYNEEQVKAWAPDNIDQSFWQKSFQNKFVFVAKEYELPIGFCELCPSGYVDRFYVAKSRLGAGVGKKLYFELESKARALKVTRPFVDASITAVPFFLKMGFKVVREQKVQLRGVEFINFRMEKGLTS